MTPKTTLAMAAGMLILLAGCGGGDAAPEADTPAPSTPPATASAPAPTAVETTPETPTEDAEDESPDAPANPRQRQQAAAAGSGDAVQDVEGAMGALEDLGMQCDGPTPADIVDGDLLVSIQAIAECVDGEGYALVVVTDEDTDPDAYWEQEFLLADVASYIDEEALAGGASSTELHSSVRYVGPYAIVATADVVDQVDAALASLSRGE